MKKFFGAKVVAASKATSGTRNSPRRQVGAQRSHLTRPGPEWWSAKQREGLSIRQLSHDEVSGKCQRLGWEQNAIEGERWWTVDYSKKYKGVTMAFIQIVMSGGMFGAVIQWTHGTNNSFKIRMDFTTYSESYPGMVIPFCSSRKCTDTEKVIHPCMLRTLCSQRDSPEYSQAVDFVERAMFTYERSFIGAFNFTSGMNRIDFDYVENRPFFLALHRQITSVCVASTRHCVDTFFQRSSTARLCTNSIRVCQATIWH